MLLFVHGGEMSMSKIDKPGPDFWVGLIATIALATVAFICGQIRQEKQQEPREKPAIVSSAGFEMGE